MQPVPQMTDFEKLSFCSGGSFICLFSSKKKVLQYINFDFDRKLKVETHAVEINLFTFLIGKETMSHTLLNTGIK